MTRKYFGTDGIRGQANRFPLTPKMIQKAAMAAALILRERQGGAHQNRVLIGKDTRLSGYMVEQALTSGFLGMGMDVLLVGPIPTPAVAMLTRSLRADIGVMVSASHNPYQDNGIKLFGADGFKLDDAIELKIEALIDENLDPHLAAPDALGKASRIDDASGRYMEAIKSSFPKGQSLAGMKIVVDCAHGAAYKVAPAVLWELEADVISIGVHPNGRNINDGCGATHTKALQDAVVAHKADLGIALDGDADRLILVDEKGQRIDGDQIMGALALYYKDKNALRGNALISTVMSNMGLARLLFQHGIDLIRTPVGDRYVMEKMIEGDFNLGGEQSGHLIMSDYGTTGDGLLAALQCLAILIETGQKASQAFSVFQPVPQLLKNVKLDEMISLEKGKIPQAIQDAQSELGDKGRVLVRPSGTEPKIRVMVEGDDAAQINRIADHLCDVIQSESLL